MSLRSCLFLFALLACTIACTDEASTADVLDDSFESMERILSKDDSVKIESADLISKFSYDYYIDEHEVTVGEYSQFLGESFDSDEENLPVTDVSFYDAVFFANAKSKAMKLDTAYVYEGKTKSSDGHIVFLGNLTTDFSSNGYRLPTEAEWIYAAKKGWDPSKNAWTAENSDYKKHPVCELPKDGNGLCDMAGNVLEWTNDLLSDIRDSSVENFAGASSANALNEIVVKGGSFRNAAASIQLKNRGDVYTVTPSMHAAYVGFRLVRGIADFVHQSKNADSHEETSDAKALASASAVKKSLGTFNAILAFRDDETGNIGYISFASSRPQVTEIVDTIDAYHPVISPDGSKIAFCTRPEGISGVSKLYVRDLNAEGSNLIQLDVESAAIPRFRVVGADTQIVYVTSAANNTDEGEWKQESTWSVPFADGKFGTPKKLFDGTYNGGVLSDGSIAVSGARLLRARVNGQESIWLDGEQACNVSLSENSHQILFLDFGSETGIAFSGSSYLAHEQLLVAGSNGKLKTMIPAPQNFAFDHSEWVENVQNYAVAALTDADGAHSKIVLVNTLDSSILDLASGSELWHPNLWVYALDDNDNSELELDSAGVYLEEGDEFEFQALRAKMELFWDRADSLEVVLLGSSRVEDGLNSFRMDSSYATINMGHPGNSFSFIKYIAENYVLNHTARLKAIVISLDLDIWQTDEDYYYLNRFKNYPGVIYDSHHHFWKNGTPQGFKSAVQSAYAVQPVRKNFLAFLGHSKIEATGWGNVAEINTDSTWASVYPDLVETQFSRLEALLSLAKLKGIPIVGIIFPQSPLYRETGSFGRYGPQRSVALQMIERLEKLQKSHSNFVLMDQNKMGNHDYTDDMAHGVDHLASPGAKQLTDRLDSVLKTLETFR